jgi:uncharacterized membrane protein
VARASRRGAGLDQPVRSRSSLPRPSYDEESFGRLGETIARFMGTGKFLVGQTVLIIVWIAINVSAAVLRFDPYPFILLNLAFSTQAAYAAPLILLAQNRQDDRDRASLASDREQNSRIVADADYLTREVAALRVAMGDVVTRDFLRAELRSLLEEMSPADGSDERPDRPGKKKRKAVERKNTEKLPEDAS